MSYDQNGNIQTLNRADIDQLTYSYGEGNKLLSVSDATSNTAGFADGNTSGNDYEYWPDGSLKKDLNRGITDIQYNLLKLPKQISFSTGKVVSYTYTASGQKLRMSTSTGDVRDYTTYTRFLNSHFEQIPTPEGRVVPGDDDPARYEYFHVDHLGNIRAVYYDSLGAIQVGQWTDYDPWGLELSGLSKGANSNRLKFNGKESLAELGSGVLDYGARLYDATIGRWGVVDPLAEVNRRFSPFVYGNNNPVRMIDPDGRETKDQKNQGFEYSDGYSTQNSRNTTGSVSFEGAYQNGGDDGKQTISSDPQPKPGRVAQTTQERQQESQINYKQMLDRGDGIEPDRTIESIFVGGAITKPVSAFFGRLFGGILGRFFGKVSPEITLANGTLSYTVENIAGFYVRGSSSIVKGTYNRTIQALASLNEGTSIPQLLRVFEMEARSGGANKIILNGIDIVETRLINPQAAQRLGYSFQQASSNSIQLTKILK